MIQEYRKQSAEWMGYRFKIMEQQKNAIDLQPPCECPGIPSFNASAYKLNITIKEASGEIEIGESK